MEDQNRYIQKLREENEKLSRKNLQLIRELSSLKKDISGYETQIEELLETVANLESELEDFKFSQTPAIKIAENPSINEFLSPKLKWGSDVVGGEGIDKNWENVMMAFTDEIFVNADEPDLPIYLDKEKGMWLSFTGSFQLKSPVTQEVFDQSCVIKIRKATEKELASLCQRYNL